ncbi:MAG TPA: HD domain-containing protein [Longimicrobiales bacterium]|nr:HD domain-containing protein [Longimicrobiales bacterium]
MTGETPSSAPRPVVLRDPLWDTIRIDALAMRIVDSAAFQRLRYIKQLGLAHLVYPGATHTRFDHALGVYHLAQRALAVLGERNALARVGPDECRLIPLAGLLHDIGHYPFSHAVEELEEGRIPGHHEAVVGRFLQEPEVRAALESVAPGGAERVEALIRGHSESPLQGLVSGSLDLDKIEYLRRDAWFCGVPYGDVDVDRLLHALAVLPDPASGRLEVGVHEKGVAALESLLFSKYQMFRNVYWHHAVRAATVMYKRIVDDALAGGLIAPDELVGQTDEALLFLLESRAVAAATDTADRVARWVAALRARQLPKRAAEVVAAEIDGRPSGEWVVPDSPLKRAVEERIAAELGLPPGSAYLDYPEKPAMFGLDLLLQRRSGEVLRLGPMGRAGLIGLPSIAEGLYQSARVLRLFTWGARREVASDRLAALAQLAPAEVEARLREPAPLLR